VPLTDFRYSDKIYAFDGPAKKLFPCPCYYESLKRKKFQAMKTSSLPAVVLAIQLAAFSCSGQQAREKKEDSAPRPDIRYKVDKRYDSKGNVIRYDSTYTWSYSSDGNTMSDSIAGRLFRFEDSVFPFFRLSPLPDSSGNSRSGRHAPFNDIWTRHRRMFEEMERRMQRMQELMPPYYPHGKQGNKSNENKEGYEL
jgi:hypothetical protein